MLSAIFDVLQGIVEFFERVFDIITFIVSEIIEAVGLALQAIAYCTAILVQMPVVWVSAFGAIITICVIYKVKG